jgi:hypothetical protein
MGFFDALGFGGRDNSAGRAAEAQNLKTQEAIDGLQGQFDRGEERLNPFIEGGTDAFGRQVTDATQGGLEANLAAILGGDAFQTLRDERLRDAQGQLSAGGLTRSGTALETISDIPTDLAFQIENLLSGRTNAVAGQGFNAVNNLNTADFNTQNQIGSLLSAQGSALAGGIFGDERARQAQDARLLDTLKSVGEFGADIYTGGAYSAAKGITGGGSSGGGGRQGTGGSAFANFFRPSQLNSREYT